ncbi:MAG: PSD1 and planctomycete cytochrome C domain-containing protein [Verrucomicrobiales bacterium]
MHTRAAHRILLPLFCLAGGLAAARAQEPDFFEKRIRPVLSEHCSECHGAEKQKGELRLDSRAAMLEGGESGPAIVVGKPDESLLLKAVRHTEKDLKMPPAKAGPKLSDDAIADLAAWVQAGAAWPQEATSAAPEKKEKFDLQAYKERLPWIWQIPERQPVPDAPGATEVDKFIAAKLAAKGLTPAPATDDLTWLRRIHFTLTGLPPQRDATAALLADTSLQRRERVVDALLGSVHFGERWARHWMDLVRYAESRGHESDFLIANAWRYRDYLIRAFNADVPYDRLVAEHVAGDLLPPRLDPATGANESIVATGWAFLGEEVHSPVDTRQDECERIDNKVDVLSKTFLGLTVACARCHDHKFDAITQKDYYAMSGFLLSSPYRQTRFETMASHAQAAEKLAAIRKKHTGALTAAFANAAKPAAGKLASQLLAAPGASAPWAEHLKQAAVNPQHPLHAFALLASNPDAGKPERFKERLTQARTPAPAIPSDAVIVADFTRPGATLWRPDGPCFGPRPLSAGEAIAGNAERPLSRIMPYGSAMRDTFWNRLSLAPGTEGDSGSQAATERAGRTLLTPRFTLKSGRLHYLIRGKATVYTGVNTHIMITGPLHGSLRQEFDTGEKLSWVTHELKSYAGHRTHVEIAPQADSALEVLMVVDAPEPPAWLPVTSWQPKADAPSLQAVADAMQTDALAALDCLAAGKTVEPHLAPLADWLLQHAALLGVNPAALAEAATAFLNEQDELAATIRWESALAPTLSDLSGVDEHLLVRGKYQRPGAVVLRGLPQAFGMPRIAPADSSGRAELARQITDPANPLIARVMVNRVWHHLFGRGIVPTVDNFGYLGERPSHPELLDHLAWQFVHEDRWSVKMLIRRLILTDTFARSSRASDPRAAVVDPKNLLLHYLPVRRLEGESIRDALLSVSGRLDARPFGQPVPVHLTAFIVGRGSPGSGPLDGDGRRSIYTSVRRNFLPSMMQAFDFPTPFSTVGRRNVTNVPAQSLVMMNDPFVRDQATLWAARMMKELPEAPDASRITWLFESAFTRPPGAEELRLATESLEELRTLFPGEQTPAVWPEFCHALLNANDFIYLK